MYVLRRRWADRYLDYALLDDHVRIDVRAWAVLTEVADQYYIRPKSPLLLLHYLRKVGMRGVWAKVVSRLKESARNEKFVAVGLGIVLESAVDGSAMVTRRSGAASGNCRMLDIGSFVAFLATNHPRCAGRVVVEQGFLIPWPPIPGLGDGEVRFLSSLDVPSGDVSCNIVGWTPYSGVQPDEASVSQYITICADALEQRLTSSNASERLATGATGARQTVRERTPLPRPARRGKPTGVLFGLGQYAKVYILPNVRKHIDIRKIHEIDPLQIGPIGSAEIAYDTRPYPREDEDFDVYFAAGYHHLHGDIALEALKRGRYTVVEKPLATTRDQLQKVEECLQAGPSRLFVCFHKRYSTFNPHLLKDLDVRTGEPVNYHCLVHEMPLPRNHWYRWPQSGGRIVYNGCHWIDHFLFLNDYAPIRSKWAYGDANGDITALIQLENGAQFTMTLSAFGSSLTGEREYVEVATTRGVARITNGMRYESESSHRFLRRARENQMALYSGMYRQISRRIVDGVAGDAARSLASSHCALDLQNQIDPSR